MKKVILFTLIATIFISCEGPMGPRGYDGRDGHDGLLSTWKVIEMPVNANQWVEYTDNNGLNRFYAVDINVPEITENIFLDGLILCYLYRAGTPPVQTVLPSVRHYENTHGDLWTQTIDYEYYNGGISIYVTNSDFAIDPPGDMFFVLQILY